MLKTHLRCFSQSAQRLHFGFANVNKVTLVGNVGQKPEIKRRTGEDGTERMYGNFSMATSETIRRSEGEYEKVTQWHRVSIIHGKMAELTERFIDAGTKVYVEGKLQYREYEKDGVKRTSTEILVSNEGCLVVLSPKESSSGGGDSANAANVNSVGRTSATPTGGSSGRR